jgi:hypothetical protein
MADIITGNAFTEAIVQAASDRYDIEQTSELINDLYAVAEKSLNDVKVVQLRRKTNPTPNRHTILIAIVDSSDHFMRAMRWAAVVRDELTDPCLSALYLMGGVTDGELSLEACTNIEANEQYCRKYFLRPQESVTELIERTFLFPLSNESSDEEITDPLHAAFSETANELSWFTAEHQEHWRTALLSGKTGAELIEYLFNEEEPVKPEDNEVSGEANDQ